MRTGIATIPLDYGKCPPWLFERMKRLLRGIVIAVIEEVLKFYTGYLFIRKKPDFDEPVDAMIYLIAVGLGFATVENILIVYSLF